jgi:large subunit ribosomal protein L15
MPLFRRLPKHGFNNANFTTRYTIVNVSQLEAFSDQTQVDATVLKEAGLIKSEKERIKILGNGELSRPLTVLAHKFSKSAMDKISKAGGQAQEIQSKQTA